MRDQKKLIIALVIVGVALVLAWSLYQAEQRRQQEIAKVGRQMLDVESDVIEARSSGERTVALHVYRPGAVGGEDDFLEAKESSILETDDIVLNAHQIITRVLEGPPVLFSSEPRLRQFYLLEDGTAVVDLPAETVSQLLGGITTELALVRSITRSLIENLPPIKRVKFIVEGQERPTLAGHVSIHQAFM
ncbi:MAG: GerMN domain-containing protein [Acidobacteriota bacterium]